MRSSAEVKGRAAVDGDSVRHHLVGLRFSAPGFEGVGIGRVGVKDHTALDREGELLVTAVRRSEEGACTASSADGDWAGDNPAGAQCAGIHRHRSGSSGGPARITHNQGASSDGGSCRV